MSELDLDAIKAATRELVLMDGEDPAYTLKLGVVASCVPFLIAEIERLQRLAGADPSPSSYAYENAMTALADERAKVGALVALLAEVLSNFYESRGDLTAVRSGWVMAETLQRWRSHLRGESSG